MANISDNINNNNHNNINNNNNVYTFTPMPSENFNESFKHDPNRGKWDSKWSFYLACLGHGIGIRNLYLFYYFYESCGGAAFIVAVILMIPVVSSPLFFNETFMGQFSNTGIISVFRVSPFYKGIGFVMLILNFFSVIYFSLISAYPLAFIYKLFTYEAPWNIQGNNLTLNYKFNEDDPVNYTIFNKSSAPSVYFLEKTNELYSGWNDSSHAKPLMLIIVLVWALIALCLCKGIRSVSKMVYITSLGPIILLFFVAIRKMFMSHDIPARGFFSANDLSKLGSFNTWMGAIVIAVHMLSQGWGILIVLGSFNEFRAPLKNISRNITNIAALIHVFGIIAITVFSNYLHSLGIDSEKLINGGFNLAFLLFPDFVTSINASQAWSWCFYIMLFLFEFHSIVLQMLAILQTIFDEFIKMRKYSLHLLGGFCTFFAVIGIILASMGMYPPCDKLLIFASFAHLWIYMIELAAFVWSQFSIERFAKDIEFTFGKQYNEFRYRVYATPVLVTMAFVWLAVVGMPPLPQHTTAWPLGLTIVFLALCILFLPGFIIYKYVWKLKLTFIAGLRESVKPHKWHPAGYDDHLAYTNSMITTPLTADITENIPLDANMNNT